MFKKIFKICIIFHSFAWAILIRWVLRFAVLEAKSRSINSCAICFDLQFNNTPNINNRCLDLIFANFKCVTERAPLPPCARRLTPSCFISFSLFEFRSSI